MESPSNHRIDLRPRSTHAALEAAGVPLGLSGLCPFIQAGNPDQLYRWQGAPSVQRDHLERATAALDNQGIQWHWHDTAKTVISIPPNKE